MKNNKARSMRALLFVLTTVERVAVDQPARKILQRKIEQIVRIDQFVGCDEVSSVNDLLASTARFTLASLSPHIGCINAFHNSQWNTAIHREASGQPM